MTPAQILAKLWRDGLSVTLTDDDRLKIQPASNLVDSQRELLRTHKAEIVAFLHDAHDTATELVEVAKRVCDQHGDGQAGREEMRADCLALPPHLQADLLDHFLGKPAEFGRLEQAKAEISTPARAGGAS